MTPPINIDGTDITGASIDGTNVTEITVDGTPVFSTIPDSGLLHGYDFRSSNPLTDIEGSDNLSGQFRGTVGDINGNQAARFSRSNADSLTATFSSSISNPFDVFVVYQFITASTGSSFTTIYDGSSDFEYGFLQESDGFYQIFAGGSAQEGTAVDTNPHLGSVEWRGGTSNDTFFLDQSQDLSYDAGSNDARGVTLGANPSGGNHFDGDIAFWGIYDPNNTNYSRTSTANALVNIFGPF